MDTPAQKKELISQIYKTIQSRLTACKQAMEDYSEALLAEGKSSAGDKYETGRAMIHQEMDQTKAQRAQWEDHHVRLKSIEGMPAMNTAELGALVQTNRGHFFLFAAIGQFEVDGLTIFSMGMTSPLGQAMLGKGVGSDFSFRGVSYSIVAIA
ncbi:MAG: hypothetical protein SchgKO_22880 [Schleiferiaceae bacterium]